METSQRPPESTLALHGVTIGSETMHQASVHPHQGPKGWGHHREAWEDPQHRSGTPGSWPAIAPASRKALRPPRTDSVPGLTGSLLASPPLPRETHHGQWHSLSPKANPFREDPQSPPAVPPGARQAGCHDAESRGTPRTSGGGGICSGPDSGPCHFLRGRRQFRQRGRAPGRVLPPLAVAPHRLPQRKSRFCTAGTVELAFCPVTRWRSSTTCTASGSLAAGDPECRGLRRRAGRLPRRRRPRPAIPAGAPTAL